MDIIGKGTIFAVGEVVSVYTHPFKPDKQLFGETYKLGRILSLYYEPWYNSILSVRIKFFKYQQLTGRHPAHYHAHQGDPHDSSIYTYYRCFIKKLTKEQENDIAQPWEHLCHEK